MGDAEVNVAYDGPFGDLSSAGDAMFNVNDDFDFGDFVATNFTAINDGQSTVSPQDVFNSTDSIPPSTSFTNLTTPGSTVLDTPDEDYETSPLFDNVSFDHNGSNSMFPLFPEENNTDFVEPSAPLMARTTSGNQVLVHPGGESTRKRSSTVASPAVLPSPVVKHSDIAGVAPRKRDKPLPPIFAPLDDEKALKRARNTAAARKSRAKKVAERDDLEEQITDLKAQVEYWKARATGKSAAQKGTEE